MIGLDTNVLVAWVLTGQARPVPAAAPYRITHVALAELVWVLSRTMRYPRPRLIAVLDAIFEAGDVVIDKPAVAKAALQAFRKGRADFADFLIAEDNNAAGCVVTLTLDKTASKEPNFRLLEA